MLAVRDGYVSTSLLTERNSQGTLLKIFAAGEEVACAATRVRAACKDAQYTRAIIAQHAAERARA